MTGCRKFFAGVVALLFLSAMPVSAADDTPFFLGETIRYTVKQMGIKVGEATLAFKGETYWEGRKYDLVVFTAKGLTFFDEEKIYLDRKTYLPVRIMRDLNIFGHEEKIMEEYDHQKGRITISKISDGKTSVHTINKKGPVDNIYGFIYRYRLNGSMDVGRAFDVRLPTLDVKIKILREDDFRIGKTAYPAVMMRSVPSKYTLWFDKSEKRLPLRISGAIGLANTVMTMTEAEE